jgi:hypothetical protein
MNLYRIELNCAVVPGVQAAVCGSAYGSVRAVRAAVCSISVIGSVWQCVRQCAATIRQCVVVCGSVQQCGSVCVAVRQCAAV